MRSFKEEIYENLSDYRERTLKIPEMGYWKNKPYGHILPKDKKKENIFPEYQKSFFNSELGRIKLHLYFHHLNSSQAMCINFFYPIFTENKLDLITNYLGFKDEVIDYNSVRFEKESDIDKKNNRRPTNFDFYFKTKSGKNFFFEIKYTESDFGKAKNDLDHHDKFLKVYCQHLPKVVQIKYTEMTVFLKHYQIVRNLIHINESSYVVFLYPKKNTAVNKAAHFAEENILNKDKLPHLFNITWEDIILNLKSNPNVNSDFLGEFKKKYFVNLI